MNAKNREFYSKMPLNQLYDLYDSLTGLQSPKPQDIVDLDILVEELDLREMESHYVD